MIFFVLGAENAGIAALHVPGSRKPVVFSQRVPLAEIKRPNNFCFPRQSVMEAPFRRTKQRKLIRHFSLDID